MVKSFFEIKKWIGKMMQAAGKDSIDVLCMFIAGDMIGIAIHAIAGMVVKAWNWLKNLKFFKIAFGIMKGVVKIYGMIMKIPMVLGEALLNAGKQLIAIATGQGSVKGIVTEFARPWKEWWNNIKSIFGEAKSSISSASADSETFDVNPLDTSNETLTNVNATIKKLGGGGKIQENRATLDRWMANVGKDKQTNDILKKLQSMKTIYAQNAEQVSAYNDFIASAWEIGRGDEQLAQLALKSMLESPEISQRLLSAFFYYNPDTGETQMMRPASFIGNFIYRIQ